jgi:hypothetical protein
MYDILKDIIYDKSQIKTYNTSENSFIIKENDKLAKCKKIELLQFESENTTFGFELDTKGIKKVSQYFENNKGLDKGNDAIIFTTLKDKQYVFICELKDGGKGYISQFKSSSCFVDYLKSILKRIHDINIDNISFKYIVFSKKGSINTTRGKYIPSKQDGLDVYHVDCSRGKYHIGCFV